MTCELVGDSSEFMGSHPSLRAVEQLDRYPRDAIPDFRNRSVGILPHLQNVDVFPSLTSVRHLVGDVAHDKSTVGAA